MSSLKIRSSAPPFSASLEGLLVIFCLVLFGTHFYIPGLMADPDIVATAADTDGAMWQMVAAVVWACVTSLIVLHSRRLKRYLGTVAWIAPLVLITVASAYWSQDPAITLRKSVYFLLTTAFGVFFAIVYDRNRQLRMATYAGLILAVLSLLLAVFVPVHGLDHFEHEGVLKGVFTQKNVAARSLLFFIVCALAYRPTRFTQKAVRWTALVLMTLCVALTQSMTAVVLYGLVLAVYTYIQLVQRSEPLLKLFLVTTLSIVVLSVAYVLLTDFQGVAIALGRDPTLTGRIPIWNAVLVSIHKRSPLGYGYQAFWTGMKGESANILFRTGWVVPAAHNGFLDVWLQTGALGLACFLAMLARWFYLSGRVLLRFRPTELNFAIVALVLFIAYNVDESSAMAMNDFLWILPVMALVDLERYARIVRLQQPVLRYHQEFPVQMAAD